MLIELLRCEKAANNKRPSEHAAIHGPVAKSLHALSFLDSGTLLSSEVESIPTPMKALAQAQLVSPLCSEIIT